MHTRRSPSSSMVSSSPCNSSGRWSRRTRDSSSACTSRIDCTAWHGLFSGNHVLTTAIAVAIPAKITLGRVGGLDSRPPTEDSPRKTSGKIVFVECCRELAQWIFESRIRFHELPDGQYDSIMGRGSGGGIIFGNTGGVMEATLRAVWLYLTGTKAPASLLEFKPVRGLAGVREASLEIDGKPLRVAVVHGTGTVRPILDEILKGNVKYDFIEVMACPGGCIGGGGQPKPNGNGRPDDSLRQKRIDGLYTKDERQTIRCSADNPDIKTIYQEFLGKPLSPLSHELLHTSYRPSGSCDG